MDYTQPTHSERGYHQAYTTRSQPENTSGVWSTIVRVGGSRALASPDDVWAIEVNTMQKCVELALNRKIASTSMGLITRDIQPDLDFRDQNGNHVDKREWRQPWSGSYAASGSVLVYQTSQLTDYQKKIYGFFGVKLTDAGTGRPGTNTNAASVTFRDQAKLRDIITIEGLDASQESIVIFRQPIIYPDSRIIKIEMNPKSTGSGSFDSIQFLGCIVETNGSHIVG